MISTQRHSEVSPKGKPVYIIEAHYRDQDPQSPTFLKITDEVNKDFTDVRREVKFWRGVGRTTSRLKAQYFSEELEYVVKLHKDIEPWLEASDDVPVTAAFSDEDDVDIDDVDE